MNSWKLVFVCLLSDSISVTCGHVCGTAGENWLQLKPEKALFTGVRIHIHECVCCFQLRWESIWPAGSQKVEPEVAATIKKTSNFVGLRGIYR